MGRMKDTIPENYSCVHYLDVDDCFECQHAMRTTTEYNANEFPQQKKKYDLSKKRFHNNRKRRK